MLKLFFIIGYHILLFSISFAKIVCLKENIVIEWNFTEYHNIKYAYIDHIDDLIATIASPKKIIIEEQFSKTSVNVSGEWFIEISISNVTIEDNGTYACTIGFSDWSPSVKMKKEITVIDPDLAITLHSLDNECKTIRCSSKYNFTLKGPGGRRVDGNSCLSRKDAGIYACCLLDNLCFSKYCKLLNVDIVNNAYSYTVIIENTTPTISTRKELIQYTVNLNVQLYITVGLLVFVSMCFISFAFITTRKIFQYRKKDSTHKPDHKATDFYGINIEQANESQACLNKP